MSQPGKVLPCFFFCGCIHGMDALTPEVKQALEDLLGGIDSQSGLIPFQETDHYRAEMGTDLSRTFFIREELRYDPEKLVELKLKAWEIEKTFSSEGRRLINLDPGYLNAHQVVIATFKNFTHRIYLGRGVFAHMEYVFKSGNPVPLRWTYPDFRRDDYREFFRTERGRYKKKWAVQDSNL